MISILDLLKEKGKKIRGIEKLLWKMAAAAGVETLGA